MTKPGITVAVLIMAAGSFFIVKAQTISPDAAANVSKGIAEMKLQNDNRDIINASAKVNEPKTLRNFERDNNSPGSGNGLAAFKTDQVIDWGDWSPFPQKDLLGSMPQLTNYYEPYQSPIPEISAPQPEHIVVYDRIIWEADYSKLVDASNMAINVVGAIGGAKTSATLGPIDQQRVNGSSMQPSGKRIQVLDNGEYGIFKWEPTLNNSGQIINTNVTDMSNWTLLNNYEAFNYIDRVIRFDRSSYAFPMHTNLRFSMGSSLPMKGMDIPSTVYTNPLKK